MSERRQKRENKLAESTRSCHEQHVMTTGAKHSFKTWKPQDDFPKTDLGLRSYHQYCETTRNNRGKTTKTELPRTSATRTNVLSTLSKKIHAGYCTEENSERKLPGKWRRRHPKPEQRKRYGAVRTWHAREESEKTQPDIGAIKRQV